MQRKNIKRVKFLAIEQNRTSQDEIYNQVFQQKNQKRKKIERKEKSAKGTRITDNLHKHMTASK